MTTLSAPLSRIGWTTGELSRRLRIAPETTTHWASGRRAPPPAVLAWLERVARAVEGVGPPPEDWSDGRRGRRAGA
jgi:hypothetical protein